VALLRAVCEGLLSVRAAAARAGLSVRQFRRLLRRYEEEGDAAVIHRARGRPSNHRKPEAQRQRALEQASQPVYHDFGPTLLAEHLSRDPEIGPVQASTLRLWMIEAGLWEAQAAEAAAPEAARSASGLRRARPDGHVDPWLARGPLGRRNRVDQHAR
jgi:hypothetical protein